MTDTESILNSEPSQSIAVIGMAGRFPKAADLDQFWRNLQHGVECVSFFSAAQLREAGVDPNLLEQENFVNARAIVDAIDQFDAGFFDISPREAELTDPQQRLFLECAWHALEHAGCDPARYDGLIGVYAGADTNAYATANLLYGGGALPSLIGNDKDYLATRLAFKLNLRGPAISVQTACSTSLVAVQLACEALLNYQTDIALAGGVGIAIPQTAGYWYEPGSILSPDGHCRSFDANSRGTVGGDGVGIVVLKRYADALDDGDTVHALIKGAAINNDGAMKIGFTAPSVAGQIEVITMAQAAAGVEPDTISYIEAHGTGTELGDPIEITALTEAFRHRTSKTQFCAIGSLKSNVGHMNSAAGIGGLLKTILALKHKMLPPSLNFETPNPRIDFASSPFYVNTKLSPWPVSEFPRRAGVSSFGIGGTNAHVILEEAPPQSSSPASRALQLLVWSAKTEAALDTATTNLAEYLQEQPDVNLADVAYTLLSGRQSFKHRRMLVCESSADAAKQLQQALTTIVREPSNTGVVFMFPGQGAQHPNMAAQLYANEPELRETIDRCAEILISELGLDLRELLYPQADTLDTAAQQLQQTALTQPALFVVEYALAKLWLSWGVTPQAMIGHSIGEYVAACLAGVFSLEDALRLIAARGRLIQSVSTGAMLAVVLSEQQALALLASHPQLSLAAINAPERCVLSGPSEAIKVLQQQLSATGVVCQRLHTSHAFHSEMMQPILTEFAEIVAMVKLQAPEIPYISNLSGSWITAAEATDPSYWVKHLRQPVRFAQGIAELLQEPDRVLLEVGPGQTLTKLTRQQLKGNPDALVLSTLPQAQQKISDLAVLLNTMGQLYCANVALDWVAFYQQETRLKQPLPGYPFQRERYWLEQPKDLLPTPISTAATNWLYLPYWKPKPLITRAETAANACWWVFSDESKLTLSVIERLRASGTQVYTITAGNAFERLGDHHYCIDPEATEDYQQLLETCAEQGGFPSHIVHFWSLLPTPIDVSNHFHAAQQHGFYSLLLLTQAILAHASNSALTLNVITNASCSVNGSEVLHAEHATIAGALRVISLERPLLNCRTIDVLTTGTCANPLLDQLLQELTSEVADSQVAYRGNSRWIEAFEPLADHSDASFEFRHNGVYLLTGGLGNIGLIIAEHLIKTVQAKLILVGRTGLPAREEWPGWLQSHRVDDRISGKITKIQELEALGGELLILNADVAQREPLRAAIAKGIERFGTLHGVFHCAGSVDPQALRLLDDTDTSLCQLHFGAKADAVLHLRELLPDNLDFCVLCSSLATVLGLLGGTAYAAANSFMDAFVYQSNLATNYPWISVNWDGWQAAGNTNTQSNWIDAPSGIRVLKQLLALTGVPRVVVSTQDLQLRQQQLRDFENLQKLDSSQTKDSGQRHQRPQLDTKYVAPTNDTETILAEVWQEVLGIERIGIHDNFFKLGGDSLLAIQISTRLRDIFQLEFSVHNLFEDPTIVGLAEKIYLLEQSSQQELDAINEKMALVENMSDEEVKKLLAKLEQDAKSGS